MSDRRGQGDSIRVGNIRNSQGIAVGRGAYANVQLSAGEKTELDFGVEALAKALEDAGIPASTKDVLRAKVLPRLAAAVDSDEPQAEVADGLERLNDHLEAIGSTATGLSGIATAAHNIAKIVGLAIPVVAPWLATLI